MSSFYLVQVSGDENPSAGLRENRDSRMPLKLDRPVAVPICACRESVFVCRYLKESAVLPARCWNSSSIYPPNPATDRRFSKTWPKDWDQNKARTRRVHYPGTVLADYWKLLRRPRCCSQALRYPWAALDKLSWNLGLGCPRRITNPHPYVRSTRQISTACGLVTVRCLPTGLGTWKVSMLAPGPWLLTRDKVILFSEPRHTALPFVTLPEKKAREILSRQDSSGAKPRDIATKPSRQGQDSAAIGYYDRRPPHPPSYRRDP